MPTCFPQEVSTREYSGVFPPLLPLRVVVVFDLTFSDDELQRSIEYIHSHSMSVLTFIHSCFFLVRVREEWSG